MKKFIFSTLVLIWLSVTQISAQSLKTAKVFSRNEQFEDAEKVFEQLINKKPKTGPNYYYAAMNQFSKGDSAAAVALLEKGGINAPKCKMVLVGKGYVSLRQGEEKAAENYFQQSLDIKKRKRKEINKEIARSYLNQPFATKEKSIEYAKKAKDFLQNASNDFESKLLLGDAYAMIDENDLSAAVQQFIVSGYEEPNDPRPLLREAFVYRRAKNYELAKLRIQQALSKDADYAPAYRQLAEIFQLMEQADSSIHYFEEYLKRNNNLSARVRFVEALYLNSEFDRAITEGKSLLDQKEIPNIYGVIAYSYVGKKKTTAEEVKDGLKNFKLYEEKFVSQKKRDLSSREHFFKANLLFRDGQIGESWKSFENSLKDTDKASITMYDASKELFYNLGKDVSREISSLPKNDSTVEGMTLKMNLEKQKYDAYNYAYKALQMKRAKNGSDSLNLVDLFYAGRCLNFMDRNEEALEVYNEIIQQDTNYISGYYLIATTSALIDPSDTTGNVRAAYQTWIDRLDSAQFVKYKKDVENAYRNMAFFAQKNKDYEMTSHYYGKVLELRPDDETIADIKARIDDYLEKVRAREARLKEKEQQ